MVAARRMHFTLGVMSLEAKEAPSKDDAHVGSAETTPNTLEAAAKLLEEIKPDVMALLGGKKLRVSLDLMDIMRPERGDPERTHVVWVGPSEKESTDRFRVIGRTC